MLQLKNIGLDYPAGAGTVHALRRVNLILPATGRVLVAGESGSGKSSLLRILAGAEEPSRGEVCVNGEATGRWQEPRLAAWRRRVGAADEALLLGDRTLRENAFLAALTALGNARDARESAAEALELTGLRENADKLPCQLSDGERALAALACAAARSPEILLVDEPALPGGQARETVLSLLRLWSTQRLLIVSSRDEDLFDGGEDMKILLREGEAEQIFNEPEEPVRSTAAAPPGMGFGGRIALALRNLGSRRSRAAARLGGVFAVILCMCLGLSVLEGEENRTRGLQAETLAAYPIVLTAENVSDGDLEALAQYLETEMDIHSASLQRTWAITPTVYALDAGGAVRQVNPEPAAGTSLWREMPDGEDLRAASYTLVAGRWPMRYDEAAVLLDVNGNIDRTCLAALGLSETAAASGVSYTELMRLSFRVVLPTEKYVRNVDGTWGYIGEDPEVMAATARSALALKITGVLRPVTRGNGAQAGGALYLSDLTGWIKNSIAASRIVTAQTADPNTDVLTNRAFDAAAHATEPGVQRMALERYIVGLSVSGQAALYERMTGASAGDEAVQDRLLTALYAMSDEALAALYAREIESAVSPGSYEDNLRAFGARDSDTVTGLRLYANTFAYRGALLTLLEGYSRRVTHADAADGVISAGAELLRGTAGVYPALRILLAALGLFGVLFCTVPPLYPRRREAAVLRARGLTGAAVRSILAWEGLILGGLGAVTGALIVMALGKVTGGALLGVRLELDWPTAIAAVLLGAAAAALAAFPGLGDVRRRFPAQAGREAL